MIRHLSADEISKWTLGERTFRDEAHVRECPQCQAEVERLESALGLFRAGVRDWSGRQPGAAPQVTWRPAQAPNFLHMRPARWAVVALALSILLSVFVYRNVENRRREAEMARADAELLEKVDAGISRNVAAPMAPLTRLVSWNSGSE